MKRISEKMKAQKVKEKELSLKLWLKQKGRCANPECQCDLMWCFPPASKHEIKRRSQGGDPLDEKNCQMLCGVCHLRASGIKVVD